MTRNLKPEPPPVLGTADPTWPSIVRTVRALGRGGLPGDPVWDLVALDGEARDAGGVAKYGMPHRHDNGRDHARDAYQEALDGLCYAHAEAARSGWSPIARALFGASLDMAHAWRAYLYVRDGR